MKDDPKLVAASRELPHRWLEKVNSGQYLPESAGKYEVSRMVLENRPMEPFGATRLLEAA